ncbi:amidohydrolase family protein [Arthrobacter sp. UYEF20]|uniref:amidohydrolase family protein n=1 Tax=Arthrobacter sp. UYEF20 TaxID=1756363 RepID=UPI003392A38B
MDLADALCHGTRDAAYSCRAEDREGRIVPGHFADFTVLDTNPFLSEAEQLLTNRTRLTVVGGRVAFDATVAAVAP